jgi:small multidrug resistance pump
MFLTLSIFAALCFTSGGAMMKSSEGLTKLWPSVACIACFAAGAVLQALAMRGNPMGSTHIFVVGLEVALALVFGAMFFHEHLTFPKVGAVTLILVGMILLRKMG